jgi:hypothetical protein
LASTAERSEAFGVAFVQETPPVEPDIRDEHGPGLLSGRPRM